MGQWTNRKLQDLHKQVKIKMSTHRGTADKWGSAVCRVAEAELCAVSEERDGLLPQLEEARWRNRQADKDLAHFQDTAAALQQVRARP